MKLSTDTLMPVGLFLTLAVVVFYAGASWLQISANAEDNEDQDTKLAAQERSLREIDRGLTRSLILQENVNTVTARQEDPDSYSDVKFTLEEWAELKRLDIETGGSNW